MFTYATWPTLWTSLTAIAPTDGVVLTVTPAVRAASSQWPGVAPGASCHELLKLGTPSRLAIRYAAKAVQLFCAKPRALPS